MVHEKDLKSSKDLPGWMTAAPPGGGAVATSPTATLQRRLPALSAPPPTVWPWWAHMDPSYPEALLAFLEMRLRRKYLQDRRPQRCLINDGTQTDDVAHSPVDAHSSKPHEYPSELTSEPSNAHSARQDLTDERFYALSLSLVETPKQLTGEPSDAHSSKPFQSPKHLTNEPLNPQRAIQLKSLKHLTDERTDDHSLWPLESPKQLTNEPSDAHSSRPLQSLKHLTNEPSNPQSAMQPKTLKNLTDERDDAHSLRSLESPKQLTNEPSNANSSRPLQSLKHLPNEPSNPQSARQLKTLKHLTDERADDHSFRPLESPKQFTNEPSDAHRSRPSESPKHLTSEISNAHSARQLKILKHVTDELSDPHSVRMLESPKHLTSEPSDTHNSRLLESPKYITSELAETQCSRQLTTPKHITSHLASGHSLCPLDSPKHLTSELPQTDTLSQHYSRLATEMSEKLHDVRYSSSYSQEGQKTVSNRRTSRCSPSSENSYSPLNQQALIQNSVASISTCDHWQEIQGTPFFSPTMETPQSHIFAVGSHFSTTRTFSMRGGEWYMEQESTCEVNPNSEANRNYPSTDSNIDRMLISKAVNPKPQSIFQKLFRFQSKSSINSEATVKCSLPFEGPSTARNDFKLGSSMCKIPTEKTCKNDFLKIDQDLLVYTFKEADKGIFYPDFNRGRRYTRGIDVSRRRSHTRSKSLEELRCIYLNRAPSFESIADDVFCESESSSSEINLFFTTMNFGTAFSEGESSSESASSSYSPRRNKDKEECIDLRNALASESGNENQHIEKTEDMTRKQNGRLPVPRTRCQHSCVRPLPVNNEQHTSVGTVTATSAATPANYCEIHDTTRERFEIEFLKKAVIKLFDMNPEQLKGDSKNFAALMEPSATCTPRTSRRSPAPSPRTPRNANRKATQLRTKETDEGVLTRVWRNIVRLVQRRRSPDSSQPAGSEQRVRTSCATLSSGKSGTKASEVKDRDPNLDGTFSSRVATLAPIDEVPETTTSGSSVIGTGPSSTEVDRRRCVTDRATYLGVLLRFPRETPSAVCRRSSGNWAAFRTRKLIIMREAVTAANRSAPCRLARSADVGGHFTPFIPTPALST